MTMNRSQFSRGAGRQYGFTLLELTVSLAILVLILVGVLQLFDANSRLARTQTHIADMQQALRVGQYQLVRTVRMAGRGPVPMILDTNGGTYAGKYLPTGIAVDVKNNVAANTHIAGSTSPLVAEGTDILTVRGVISGSLYQLNQDTDVTLTGTSPNVTGQVVIHGQSPAGVTQNLAALKEELDKNLPNALLLVSPASDELYAVAEITGSDTTGYDATDIPNSSLTVSFRTSGGSEAGTDPDKGYLGLTPNGAIPDDLTKVAFVGILEEYRYYIRQDAVTTDLGIGPTLRLSRAQVYPGTDDAYAGDDANLREDIADNIRDLQVALGVENEDPIADPDDQVTESDPPDENDEWLFNAAADDPGNTIKWNGVVGRPNRLYYVRVTTLARTDRPDPKYLSPPIANIEDHVYNEPASPATQAELNQRKFRRRLLTTVIDLRNVS